MTHPFRDRLVAWILVSAQAGLIAAAVILPRRPAWDAPAWFGPAAWALIGAALALGLWGARHLGDGLTPLPLPNGAVDLVTNGPYRWIRHPLYSAVVLGVGAIALRSRTWSVIAVTAALTVVLLIKARWEERHLRATFEGYSRYAAEVGRFVPGVGRVPVSR